MAINYENPLSKALAPVGVRAAYSPTGRPEQKRLGDIVAPRTLQPRNPGTYSGVELPPLPNANTAASEESRRQRFNKQTTLHPHEEVMDKALGLIPTSVMPTHAKVFLDSVRGAPEPVTERDFTPAQRNVMRDAVQNASTNQSEHTSVGNSATHGSVTYPDYPWARKMYDDSVQMYGRSGGRYYTKEDLDSGFMGSLFKGPDDAVTHTLGSFTYDRPPGGGTNITDRYDFATMGDKEITNWKDAIRKPYAAIHQYAAKKMPSGDVNKGGWGYSKVPTDYLGRPVNIRLGEEYEPEYARDAGKLPRDATVFSQGISFPGDLSVYKDIYERVKRQFSSPFARSQ